MSVNRWVILGLFTLGLFATSLVFVQSETAYPVAVISSLSLLSFLGIFTGGYLWDGFRAWRNPYVRDVNEMEFLFNPMYFTWLFATDRRKWSLYTTIYSAILGFALGFYFSILVFLAPAGNTVSSFAFEVGLIVGMGLLITEPLCWYMGVCRSLTVEVQGENLIEDESEREQAFSHD